MSNGFAGCIKKLWHVVSMTTLCRKNVFLTVNWFEYV